MSRLQKKYKEEILSDLMKKFNYKNIMQVPKLEKITVNVCSAEAVINSKIMQSVTSDLSKITNQKPIITKAKKSISNFKLRKGMPIGAKVTLRNKNMYSFLDKLISITIPSIKDFRGLSPKAFDKRGNYSMGLKDQVIFPELDYDQVDKLRGLGVVFTTTAKSDGEAKALLEGFGFPFRK